MYEEMLNNATRSVERFVAPMTRFNAALVTNAQKIATFQIDATKRYADLGLKHLRAGLDVSDVDGFRSYMASNQERVQEVMSAVESDTKTLADLHQGLNAEIKGAMDEGVAALGSSVTPAKAATAGPAKKAASGSAGSESQAAGNSTASSTSKASSTRRSTAGGAKSTGKASSRSGGGKATTGKQGS